MQEINLHKRSIGLNFDAGGESELRVWAPKAEQIEVKINEGETHRLDNEGFGYFVLQGQIEAGDSYQIIIDGEKEFPDPASLYQPNGVHKASEAINLSDFDWENEVQPDIARHKLVLYELHAGTFSKEGNFQGIINKLDYLKDLGVNCIELMPVAQFPGERNWGYDGVYPFAVQNSYGGPHELQKLVKACHDKDMLIVLDVVYNHLGPEGNYLPMFGHYFTDKYKTPWGTAINFDDAWSDGVRNYVIENALMWLRDFHFDGLRIDAVHAIRDFSTKHILQEMAEKVEELDRITGRESLLIAETDLNDTQIIRDRKDCGYGIQMQWCDEFHHALHAMITGENNGYYADFGETEHLAKSINDAYVYDGVFSPHRNKTFGSSTRGISSDKFIVFSQNHDQVGNRMKGERLSALTNKDNLKSIAAISILNPFVPMLFMGEEYGEKSPFLYFTSHGDQDLIEAVRKGRKEEFKSFMQEGEAPDPDAEESFQKSKLNWQQKEEEDSAALLEFYKQLIRLKKNHPVFRNTHRENVSASQYGDKKVIIYEKLNGVHQLLLICNFEDTEEKVVLDAKMHENLKSLFSKTPEENLKEEPAIVRLPANSTAIYYTPFKGL